MQQLVTIVVPGEWSPREGVTFTCLLRQLNCPVVVLNQSTSQKDKLVVIVKKNKGLEGAI